MVLNYCSCPNIWVSHYDCPCPPACNIGFYVRKEPKIPLKRPYHSFVSIFRKFGFATKPNSIKFHVIFEFFKFFSSCLPEIWDRHQSKTDKLGHPRTLFVLRPWSCCYLLSLFFFVFPFLNLFFSNSDSSTKAHQTEGEAKILHRFIHTNWPPGSVNKWGAGMKWNVCSQWTNRIYSKFVDVWMMIVGDFNKRINMDHSKACLFSRRHAFLHLAVCRYVRNISKLRVVYALLLLPIRPRLDCRVSGPVQMIMSFPSWVLWWQIHWLPF